jgi:hypothetical protein
MTDDHLGRDPLKHDIWAEQAYPSGQCRYASISLKVYRIRTLVMKICFKNLDSDSLLQLGSVDEKMGSLRMSSKLSCLKSLTLT